MDRNVRDCLVEGYEYLIPGLSLPDEEDGHVLAAAIRSRSSVIVTFNLKDFPAAMLDEYKVEAQHPDEFIAHLIDPNPARVLAAVTRHRASLKIRRSLGKIISTRCFSRACRKRWCDCGSVRWPSDKTGFSGRYLKAGLPSEQVPVRNCQRRRRRSITTARPAPSIAQVDGSGTTATECTWLGRLAPRWN
jgi:hypothetical protein